MVATGGRCRRGHAHGAPAAGMSAAAGGRALGRNGGTKPARRATSDARGAARAAVARAMGVTVYISGWVFQAAPEIRSMGIDNRPKSMNTPSSESKSKASPVSITSGSQPGFSARMTCGSPRRTCSVAVSRPRGTPSTKIFVPGSSELMVIVSRVPLIIAAQPPSSLAAAKGGRRAGFTGRLRWRGPGAGGRRGAGRARRAWPRGPRHLKRGAGGAGARAGPESHREC